MKKRFVLLLLLVIFLASCSKMQEKYCWIVTSNNISLFAADLDTTLIYQWNGNSFEGVANDCGVLSYIDADGKSINLKRNAFYGAIDTGGVTSLDDEGKYVGGVKDDMMDGFGVLIKGEEIYIGEFKQSMPNGILKLYRKSRLYYDGEWKNGAFNGEGTLYKDDGGCKTGIWENGELTQSLVEVSLPIGDFKGFIKNGKPDGLGKICYHNGITYEGYWKNGLWSGIGLYTNKTDSIYGEWVNGKINGDVVYRTQNFLFEGTCVDNSPIGIGNLTVSDGSYYSGNWLDGVRCGMGDMIFANGDSYIGDWENNMFSGYGEYQYSELNASYQGEWLEGLQNGNGKYICENFTYNGQWEKGWMDGDGVLSFNNGDKYEGTLHENLLDGVGTYIFANGDRYEGEFVEGTISGLGVFQLKNGNRFEGEFYNGKIYGDGTMYLVSSEDTVSITGFWPIDGSFPKEASMLFANGDLYEGPLKNGVPTSDGIWQSGEERQAKINRIENSTTHKLNEYYKRHKETINRCLLGVSLTVSAIEIATASTAIGAPIAAVAEGVNVAINVVDAGMAIASAAIDVAENAELGVDNEEAMKNLETEVIMNAAFIIVPKAVKSVAKPLGKGVKNVARSTVATMSKTGKIIAKKSAIRFIKGKVLGKSFKLIVSIKSGVRKIEKTLVVNKSTRSAMIAAGRLLTGFKHQAVRYSSYLSKIKNNPSLKKQLKLSSNGSSKNLGDNMRLLGTDKWVKKSERIKRYLKLPKRQVEPHHIIPSNPTTESGKQARKIWTKYFESVDHPCNGIWLGRASKNGYSGLAKGTNHVSNSLEYEEYVSKALINTYKKYQKKYAKNPEMMQKVLAETVDNIKKQLYKGDLPIGKGAHQVHTVLSSFSNVNGVIRESAKGLLYKINHM